MRKNQHVFAYALILLGMYFFITQFDHPLIHRLNSWTVLVIGIGIWLLYTYIKIKKPQLLIEGFFILFVGIHFYGLQHFSNWPNDWSIFLFILGFSLLLSYVRTKKHLLLSITLILLSMVFFFPDQLPTWMPSLTNIHSEVDEHWPVFVILCGVLLLFYNRK